MVVYEFFDEDYNKVVDTAEEIKELADHLIKCLNKANEKEDEEVSFRRSYPRMRGGSSPSLRGGSSPSMRKGYPRMRGGYVVRPEDEDWRYSERFNW